MSRGRIGGVVLLSDSGAINGGRDRRPSGKQQVSASENRTPSQKDVDRLYYARSFLRLAAVTQISTPDPLRPVIHNRLTHSLKVAQIARTIAANLICEADKPGKSSLKNLILSLGGLDAAVAEAAALAHDVGHPPYGHAGEKALNRLARQAESPIPVADGFEGNAQSFRTATKTDPMYEFQYGLNLTAATRAAILKYPWAKPTTEIPVPPRTSERNRRLREKKFGYYFTERSDFEECRSWLDDSFNDRRQPRQTLEASVMDIADDITYAVHDYEDFLTMGVLHRDTVQADLEELAGLESVASSTKRPSIDALVDELAGYERFQLSLLKNVAANHLSNLPSLFLSPYSREFRNKLLDSLLGAECIEVGYEAQREVGAHIVLSDEAWHLVELLKFLVKHYVIDSTGLALVQAGQGALLRKGVGRLVRWHTDDPGRLPPDLKQRLVWAAEQSEPPARAYLDYVCTLGDDQFEAITLSMSGERTGRLGSGNPLG